MITLATALNLHVGYDIITIHFYFLIETREPRYPHPCLLPHLKLLLGLLLYRKKLLGCPLYLKSLQGLHLTSNRCLAFPSPPFFNR